MELHIGGWGLSPTGKSYSFRACVRAKLRVPAGRCCFRGWAARARKVLRVSLRCALRVPVPPPLPCQNHSLAKTTPLFLCESQLNDANRVNTCYSMLFNAYLRYSMLFYAILARESMLIYASGPRFRWSRCPLRRDHRSQWVPAVVR